MEELINGSSQEAGSRSRPHPVNPHVAGRLDSVRPDGQNARISGPGRTTPSDRTGPGGGNVGTAGGRNGGGILPRLISTLRQQRGDLVEQQKLLSDLMADCQRKIQEIDRELKQLEQE